MARTRAGMATAVTGAAAEATGTEAEGTGMAAETIGAAVAMAMAVRRHSCLAVWQEGCEMHMPHAVRCGGSLIRRKRRTKASLPACCLHTWPHGLVSATADRDSTDAEDGGGPPNPVKSFLDKAQQMITSFAHIVPGGLPPFLPGGGGPPDGPPGGPQPPYGDGGGIRPLAAVVPFSLQPLAAANASADNATVTGLADSMLANLKAGNSTGVRPRRALIWTRLPALAVLKSRWAPVQ